MRAGCAIRLRQLACATAVAWLLAPAARLAMAVGWDRDDFIISGAPNFPDRIGIFNHDFTFKGYLETNFVGVQGMDFDAAGNLVAIASLSTSPEVRVYRPDGARIGGFTANNPALQFTGDIKVAPNGYYTLGSYTSGAQVFTPQGTFVRQYGDGDSRGIEYVPGDRLWSGGAGTTVRIFDTVSGAQVGSFTANGQTMSYSMQYGTAENTVLVVDADRDLGGVFERDLNGDRIREFNVAVVQTFCYSATRGPGGDVFGTTSKPDIDIVRWRPDGSVASTIDCYPFDVHPVRILWAGTVPEPGTTALWAAAASTFCASRSPRSRRRS
jgi:hypothetical protein